VKTPFYRLCWLLSLIGCVLLLAGPSWAQVKGKKTAPGASLTPVGWLAGKWRLEKNGRVVDEQWMVPAGGVMLGMGRTVVRGRVTAHEFLQLREGPGGDLFLIVEATGQKPATFKSVSVSADGMVLANQLQDFPQTITYARSSDGTLVVMKEGPGDNGQTRKEEAVYRRVGD
jgi:hypothetical protein